ncbi:metal-dependent phosphohydrolase [Comamonas serinivorans]|uniref:Metal-dependent phosphohydrolase n=1 Tax=Comamonas serinivorans TaxID=1082851 RepID=A0A1Y0EJL2_9BURK|nr:AAA family ATPase [Comamonas serinivorans]ARU03611.1 metal-dependent phosphohydrolase [Comamonas serinivorans]
MSTWTDWLACVPAPGAPCEAAQTAAWLAAFPQLERAKTTPQDPVYHAEGDVWTHTQMVVNELVRHADYAALTAEERATVFTAAVLHDVAKCDTTRIDEQGRIRQPGHSRRGALDARIALWDMGAPVLQREAICRLIGVHQEPFFAIHGSRSGHDAEYLVRRLSWLADLHLLALLAEADMRGRICADAASVLDDIELFRELAKDEGCYRTPRAFADRHTALAYFRGAQVHPDYGLHHEPGARVTLMCGLPAAGKNTWVAEHRAGLPVVSFDDARTALGLRHGQNEGAVAHHAIDAAKAWLRGRRDFVWNATHLSDAMRRKSLDLCLAYGATVEVVHLEAPRATLLARNARRDTSLRNADLLAMLHKWEVPLPTEAHALSWWQADGRHARECVA